MLLIVKLIQIFFLVYCSKIFSYNYYSYTFIHYSDKFYVCNKRFVFWCEIGLLKFLQLNFPYFLK